MHCATIALRKTKNYIEKAMTETVVYPEHTESSIWWKLFMQKVHEDHSRAVRRRNQGFEALPCSCVISKE